MNSLAIHETNNLKLVMKMDGVIKCATEPYIKMVLYC